jgi:hypothetical protein
MRLVPAILVLALGLGGSAAAQTAPAAQPQVVADQGVLAMKDSFQHPQAIVDAAIAFDEARRLYQAQSDADHVREMQAYLFWCKRRMNLDDLRAWLGQKDDPRVKQALAAADAEAGKEVPASEAQAYFDRAHAFAEQHPDRHLEIAVRYFEVAERFQGTDLSLKAQRISLDEQQQHLATIADQPAAPVAGPAAPTAGGPAPTASSDALFGRRTAADGARSAMPAADALKAATSQIRQTYKDDYAKPRKSQHRALAARLLIQARATRDDPAMRWSLLAESRDQAAGAGDPIAACAAVDAAAELFDGVDAAALKKSALSRAGGPAAQSMARLLTDPGNAEAKTTLGRYLGFELGRWDEAVRLLAEGSDKELKRIADLELANPTDRDRIAEAAEAWCKLAAAQKGDLQPTLMNHAGALYARFVPRKGPVDEAAAARLEEILATVPDERLDPAVLTDKRWDAIKAKCVRIGADKDLVDSGVVLAPDKVAHLLPKPTWTWRASGEWSDTHGKGPAVGGLHPGELLWAIDAGPRQSIWSGPVVGAGHLMFGPNHGKEPSKGGEIGVKIIVLTDDD